MSTSYGPHRCEHGTLGCELCAEEASAPAVPLMQEPAKPPEPPPVEKLIQIGPLDV